MRGLKDEHSVMHAACAVAMSACAEKLMELVQLGGSRRRLCSFIVDAGTDKVTVEAENDYGRKKSCRWRQSQKNESKNKVQVSGDWSNRLLQTWFNEFQTILDKNEQLMASISRVEERKKMIAT